jgi:hypothetical protein
MGEEEEQESASERRAEEPENREKSAKLDSFAVKVKVSGDGTFLRSKGAQIELSLLLYRHSRKTSNSKLPKAQEHGNIE